MNRFIVTSLVVFGLSVQVMADDSGAKKGKGHGPCEQIKEACEQAGFVKGEAKAGYGLWMDCIDPIMQGQTSVPGATKPLPTVDAGVVTACKAKHPKFGSGKVGTPQKGGATQQGGQNPSK